MDYKELSNRAGRRAAGMLALIGYESLFLSSEDNNKNTKFKVQVIKNNIRYNIICTIDFDDIKHDYIVCMNVKITIPEKRQTIYDRELPVNSLISSPSSINTVACSCSAAVSGLI